MVVLFFLPSLDLVIGFIGLVFMIPVLTIGGFTFCACGMLNAVIFSALVHQRRQEADRGTFLLMAWIQN